MENQAALSHDALQQEKMVGRFTLKFALFFHSLFSTTFHMAVSRVAVFHTERIRFGTGVINSGLGPVLVMKQPRGL